MQNEFIALREYLRQEFSEIRKDIGELKQGAAARKAERKARRDTSRWVQGVTIASLPVALSAFIAAFFH